MEKGQSSRTASLVTLMRAFADAGVTTVPGFADPTARHFLSGAWARRFEKTSGRRSGLLYAFKRAAADMQALRTLVIDAHLRAAISRGTRQLVILGAGFDGRAYRMPELAEVDVFEVDHPSTQAEKTRLAAALAKKSRSLVHAPIDFEKDSLDAVLEAAGHRRAESTAWIWEGVVMYLTDAALRSTLKTVGARSTPGSTLIIQYNIEASFHPLGLLLALWREPMIGLRSKETMAAELRATGFEVEDDAAGSEWPARHGGNPPARALRHPRILAARRVSA